MSGDVGERPGSREANQIGTRGPIEAIGDLLVALVPMAVFVCGALLYDQIRQPVPVSAGGIATAAVGASTAVGSADTQLSQAGGGGIAAAAGAGVSGAGKMPAGRRLALLDEADEHILVHGRMAGVNLPLDRGKQLPHGALLQFGRVPAGIEFDRGMWAGQNAWRVDVSELEGLQISAGRNAPSQAELEVAVMAPNGERLGRSTLRITAIAPVAVQVDASATGSRSDVAGPSADMGTANAAGDVSVAEQAAAVGAEAATPTSMVPVAAGPVAGEASSQRLAVRKLPPDESGKAPRLAIGLEQPHEPGTDGAYFVVRNLPEGASLSRGVQLGKTSWLLSGFEAGEVELAGHRGMPREVTLIIQLVALSGEVLHEVSLALSTGVEGDVSALGGATNGFVGGSVAGEAPAATTADGANPSVADKTDVSALKAAVVQAKQTGRIEKPAVAMPAAPETVGAKIEDGVATGMGAGTTMSPVRVEAKAPDSGSKASETEPTREDVAAQKVPPAERVVAIGEGLPEARTVQAAAPVRVDVDADVLVLAGQSAPQSEGVKDDRGHEAKESGQAAAHGGVVASASVSADAENTASGRQAQVLPKDEAKQFAALPSIDQKTSGKVTRAAYLKLLDQARKMLGLGQIAMARALLERAASNGSADAALLMGKTYDPNWLRDQRVYGISAQPETAQQWYREAVKLGNAEAIGLVASAGNKP